MAKHNIAVCIDYANCDLSSYLDEGVIASPNRSSLILQKLRLSEPVSSKTGVVTSSV
jgi:hypothetical protein